MNPLRQLQAQGQAVWLDYIRRDILLDGSLQRMVQEDGVSGVTSNPAIFQKAIGESDLYDRAIQEYCDEIWHVKPVPVELADTREGVTNLRLSF